MSKHLVEICPIEAVPAFSSIKKEIATFQDQGPMWQELLSKVKPTGPTFTILHSFKPSITVQVCCPCENGPDNLPYIPRALTCLLKNVRISEGYEALEEYLAANPSLVRKGPSREIYLDMADFENATIRIVYPLEE